MGTLAFFPWFRVEAAIHEDEFSLLPSRQIRVRKGFSIVSQRQVRRVLSHYKANLRGRVTTAAVLKLKNQLVGSDLTREDRVLAFQFAELVTFSLLSERDFFSGGNYVNREDFAFVIQGFSDPSSGVTTFTRRRDGHTQNISTKRSYVIQPPPQLNHYSRAHLDRPLLRALLKARGTKNWDRFRESILNFNRSNTDSDQIWEQDEAVMLLGSFQRLLGCNSAKANELAPLFLKSLGKVAKVPVSTCERKTKDGLGVSAKYGGAKCLADAWIRDFCNVRHQPAHGKLGPGHTIWSLREHLLLATFIFPRLLKLVLAEGGLYELTKADMDALGDFEPLLTYKDDLFVQSKGKDDEDDEDEWPWCSIRSKRVWATLGEKALRSF